MCLQEGGGGGKGLPLLLIREISLGRRTEMLGGF